MGCINSTIHKKEEEEEEPTVIRNYKDSRHNTGNFIIELSIQYSSVSDRPLLLWLNRGGSLGDALGSDILSLVRAFLVDVLIKERIEMASRLTYPWQIKGTHPMYTILYPRGKASSSDSRDKDDRPYHYAKMIKHNGALYYIPYCFWRDACYYSYDHAPWMIGGTSCCRELFYRRVGEGMGSLLGTNRWD